MIMKGYRIDIVRAEAGLTVRDLAAVSKCSIGTIQRARHGREVSIMSAGRIAKALHTPLDQLIEDSAQ